MVKQFRNFVGEFIENIIYLCLLNRVTPYGKNWYTLRTNLLAINKVTLFMVSNAKKILVSRHTWAKPNNLCTNVCISRGDPAHQESMTLPSMPTSKPLNTLSRTRT